MFNDSGAEHQPLRNVSSLDSCSYAYWLLDYVRGSIVLSCETETWGLFMIVNVVVKTSGLVGG